MNEMSRLDYELFFVEMDSVLVFFYFRVSTSPDVRSNSSTQFAFLLLPSMVYYFNSFQNHWFGHSKVVCLVSLLPQLVLVVRSCFV